MKLKNLAIFLLASGLLVGCVGTENSEQTKKADIYTEVGTYPIVKEGESDSFTLFTYLRPSVTSYNSDINIFTKYLEDLTGVKLEFTSSVSADFAQKLNVMMISGEYVDAILSPPYGASELLLYGQQGIFIPLNDLIEENAPNIKKALDENPLIKDAFTSTDGNMYGLPRIGKTKGTEYCYKMWINHEWLENLDLEVPTTTEEFYQVLKAFKEQDANKNGDPNDEIPLSGSPSLWAADPTIYLLNAFIPTSAGTGFLNLSEDKQIYHVKTTNEYKEYLKFMNRLYEEELLDPLVFTQGKQEFYKLVAATDGVGKVGALPGGSVTSFAITSDYDTWGQYTQIAPLMGPDGLVSASRSFDFGTTGLVITNKCENPEVVLRVFDYMYTDEGVTRMSFGAVGDGRLGTAPEGTVNYLGEPADYVRLDVDQSTDAAWNRIGPDGQGNDFEMLFGVRTGGAYPDVDQILYLSSVNDYAPVAQDVATIIPPLSFSEDESRIITDLQLALNTYLDESALAFITGKKDIDENWDDYLKQAEVLGLSQFLEVRQTAYDRKYKN
ncbi:MAG: hypothetical protein ATN31_06030 [Candidatus Epulonipiscioides saccharophilum]|nr:MAG: hypothetical protein ATN31_06030 [Epulopiscium sp. AS2M-Bin001]